MMTEQASYGPPYQETITWRGDRPMIVCLCGSTRFWETFQQTAMELTLDGQIVLSVGAVASSDEDHGVTEEQKVLLDELHKRKIDLADVILVLNVGGYIGQSTQSEIEYARRYGVPIEYLEEPDDDY